MLPPRFLDEGAYGCIHRPPLRCRAPSKMNYQGKVSKLISTEDAKKELNEYVLMDQADPERKFYLGKPETCPLSKEPVNVTPIKKCEMGTKVVSAPDKYRLILMKDGGTNWQKFAAEMNSLPTTFTNRVRMEQFWIEAHRMMLGIRTFLANDIVHHDVKAPNIVYDTKKKRMNFIDFGLMETKSRAMEECKHDDYEWNRNWWYFPFESILLNRSSYRNGVRGMDQETKARDFIQKHRMTDDWLTDFIEQTHVSGSEVEVLLQDFVDFLKESSNVNTSKKYDQFLSQYFDTLDIYGLGIACLHVLEKTHKFMNDAFVISAKTLFMKMICFHPMKRITIDHLLNEYEQLLESTGIASKYHVTFDSVSHELRYQTKSQINHLESMAEEIVDESKKRKRSPEQVSARAEQDPISVPSVPLPKEISGRRISERLRQKREKNANNRRSNKTMKIKKKVFARFSSKKR